MEFRVLGPLEVSDGRRLLELGGRRQRMVLAVLLLNTGHTVSTDRLIDAVWGEHPPRTARKTLQVYISRLRRTVGARAITSAPEGYMLYTKQADVDAERFEEIARDGRDLIASAPAEAAALLGRALGLWRGMPWGELGDEPAIQPEAQRLRELRLSVIEDRMAAELRSGNAAALIGELEGLLEDHPLRERFSAQLMLALYRAGRQAEALRCYQDLRRRLGEELGIDPSPELQDLEEKILLQDPSLAMSPPTEPVLDRAHLRNPYKGLSAFAEHDAPEFFGRDGLVDELVERVRAHSFVVVVGASGSGKSSAVMAGVLPQMRSEPDRWTIVTMVPGHRPFDSLATALDHVSTESHRSCRTVMCGDELDVLRALGHALADRTARTLLVVDQFEEILVRGSDGADGVRFVRNLVEAVEDPSSGLTVLATLRADFFDQALQVLPLGTLVRDGQVSVVPMTAAELEAAAVRPAAAAGVQVGPELVAELTSDMADQPGALPLFQYVLTEVFEKRTGPVLTRAAYRDLGGLGGALERRADETYRGLDGAQRAAARQVFLRLVTVSGDSVATRRRVRRSEIEDLDPVAGDIKVVLDAFDEARLLTFDRSPADGEPTVEVAHEALLEEWPRLRRWLQGARDDLRLHGVLIAEVRAWEESDRNSDYLLTGSRLALYEDWAATGAVHLTDAERRFLEDGARRRDAAAAAERERRDRELRVERRSVRRLRWLVAVASVAAIVAAVLTVLAMDQAREAATSRREARARELANAAVANVNEDPELAMLLALEAVEMTRRVDGSALRESEEALHRAVNAQRLVSRLHGGSNVVFHPSGGLLIGGGAATLVDPATGDAVIEVSSGDGAGSYAAVAVNSRGDLVATGTDGQGDVMLWDAAGVERRSLGFLGDTVLSLDFSPDGRLLAGVAPGPGWLRVWDVATGDVVVGVFEPAGWDVCCPPVVVAFDPEGARVAVTMIDEVKLFEVASGEPTLTLGGHDSLVSAVGFLPDGSTIVTGGYDGTVRLWDAESGAELSSHDAGIDRVLSLGVGADGRRMLTGGDDGSVKLWSLDAGAARYESELPGLRAPVLSVSIDDTGTLGAAAGLDERVAVWDISEAGPGEGLATSSPGPVAFGGGGRHLAMGAPDGRSVVILDAISGEEVLRIVDVAPLVGEDRPFAGPDEGGVRGLAFSPTGSLLATVTTGFEVVPGSVALWDVDTGAPVRTLTEHDFLKGPVAFSGDGENVAAATCGIPGSTGSVWDVESGEVVFATPSARCGHSVDLSPDGRLLAVQGIREDEPNVQVWDTAKGEPVAAVDHLPMWIGAVGFDPSAGLLLTAGQDGTARVWDVATGEIGVLLEGHTGPVEDAIWITGDRVATAGQDGTIRLWDAGTGETLLVLHTENGLPRLDVTPDGRWLASSAGGLVRVWALEIDDLIGIAEDRLTRSLTTAECISYHFDTCPTSS